MFFFIIESKDFSSCNKINDVMTVENKLQMLVIVCFSVQITALKIKYNPFAKAFLDAKERSMPFIHAVTHQLFVF